MGGCRFRFLLGQSTKLREWPFGLRDDWPFLGQSTWPGRAPIHVQQRPCCYYCFLKRGILRNLHLWHSVGRAGRRFLPQKRHFPLIWTSVQLVPIKLITYSTVPGPSASPTQNAFSRRTLSKAIKMHAKRTLFNYGKIFVITRPSLQQSPYYPSFPNHHV